MGFSPLWKPLLRYRGNWVVLPALQTCPAQKHISKGFWYFSLKIFFSFWILCSSTITEGCKLVWNHCMSTFCPIRNPNKTITRQMIGKDSLSFYRIRLIHGWLQECSTPDFKTNYKLVLVQLQSQCQCISGPQAEKKVFSQMPAAF